MTRHNGATVGAETTAPVFDKEKEKPRPRQPVQIGRKLMALLSLLSALYLALVSFSFYARHQDTVACRMSFMYPTFQRLEGFDSTKTRFAKKYALYSYKDEVLDHTQDLQGVPVLFVPGNAGSYRQTRSIGSAAARNFEQRKEANLLYPGATSLDFFAMDFNEDFSAFDGQTLLDQAECLNAAVAYILSLYADDDDAKDLTTPRPESVILLTHSMGGVIARTVQTMPNYKARSINTIITMATPHAMPPVPFDAKIHAIYRQINTFWNTSFKDENGPLQDVALVSIVGGSLDSIVSSDYATLRDIVPKDHGFSIHTSTIPYVWTGADHLAILWCDQFRNVLVNTLLDVVDARSPGKTVDHAERMTRIRQRLLSRLDETDRPTTMTDSRHSVRFTVNAAGETLADRPEVATYDLGQDSRKVCFPAPETPDQVFELLTDSSDLTVLLCQGDVYLQRAHFELACRDASVDLVVLPGHDDLSGTGEEFRDRLYHLRYDPEQLAKRHIVVKSKSESGTFFRAGYVAQHGSRIQLRPSMLQALLRGIHHTLDSAKFVSFSLDLPEIVSSLLAYKTTFEVADCKADKAVLRQHMHDPIEAKYSKGKGPYAVSVYGLPPFLTPARHDSAGLSLQYFADPACLGSMDVTIRIDIVGSLGKLMMRYRTVLLAFPFALALAVFRFQLQVYGTTARFIPWQQATILFARSQLWKWLVAVTTVSYILSSAVRTGHCVWFKTPESWVRLLLGLQDPFLAFLAPLFVLVSFGFLHILAMLLSMLVQGAAITFSYAARFMPDKASNVEIQVGSRRRYALLGSMLFFVLAVVPYQLAYVLACLVQALTAVRTCHALYASIRPVASARNDLNAEAFNFSVLLLMILVVPVDGPILAVWARNLVFGWFKVFSNPLGVLAVAPILYLVEQLARGSMLQVSNKRLELLVSVFLAGCTAYLLLHGVYYTYLLHYTLNLVALALAAHLHFHPGTASRQPTTHAQ